MQLALHADSPNYGFSSDRSSSPGRTKILVAGLAVASASVIAVNPVTPSLPAVPQPEVALAAFTNPLIVLQETLTKTFTNLNTLGTGIPAASTALGGALTNPAVLAQLANLVTANATNPTAALTQLLNFQATYGDKIATALQGSSTIAQTNLANLPTIAQNTLNYLATGQFVEAFSEVNIYFLVQLLERPGVPLFPLFTIPGDVAAALPAGQILANVLDAVLTRGIATGLTRALFVAPITTALFIAETLDHVQASFKAGDTEAALSELVSAPVGLVDAFLNGYVPDFPSRSPFAGLLSPNGFFDYFLVDVPNAIAKGLTTPIVPTTTATSIAAASTALAPTSPTDIGVGGDTVLLKLDAAPAAVDAAPAVKAEAVSSAAPAEAVASDTGTEDSGDGTVPAADTSAATDSAADDDSADGATAGTDADTKSDGDTKTDSDKSGDSTTDKDKSDKGESDDSKSSTSTTDKDKSGSTKSGSDDSGDSGSDE